MAGTSVIVAPPEAAATCDQQLQQLFPELALVKLLEQVKASHAITKHVAQCTSSTDIVNA